MEAGRLLEDDAAREPSCNRAVREQFCLLLRARVQEKLSGRSSQTLSLLEEAARKTMLDFVGELKENELLSMQEVTVLLLWQDVQPDREAAEKVLAFLEGYLPIHCSEEQLVKLYPKAAARYLPILFEKKQYPACLAIAERTLRMMVSTGYASSMETVLDYYVKAAEETGMGQTVRRKKVQLAAWRELMQEIGNTQDSLDDELYLMEVWQEVELLDEVLSRNRRCRGYSQEELSEGVCTPESLSRIENARRAPNTSTFRALARKLSLRENYYYSNIETDDLSLLDREWKITNLILNRKWEEMQKVLEELTEKLDLSCSRNRQYVEGERYLLNRAYGRIPAEQEFSAIREILAITLEGLPESENVQAWPEDFWEHPFGQQEILVMMQMADALVHKGQIEQANYLLEKLMAHYGKSRVKDEFHFREVILILQRLSCCSGLLGKHVECQVYSEKGIRLCLVSGTRKTMPLFLNNKADALEHSDQKAASLKYYRLAAYSAELFENNQLALMAKHSYEKLTGNQLEWD